MASFDRSPLSRLTPRELDCLKLVSLHLTSKAIAKQLSISPYTVDKHLRETLQKLSVSTRREAAIVLSHYEGRREDDADIGSDPTPEAHRRIADDGPADGRWPSSAPRSRARQPCFDEAARGGVSELQRSAAPPRAASDVRVGSQPAAGAPRPAAAPAASHPRPAPRRRNRPTPSEARRFLEALTPAQTLLLVAGVGLGAALVAAATVYAARAFLEAVAVVVG